jgi:GntR family transcriptional regulator
MYVLKFEENMPIYIQIIQKIKADLVSGKIKGGDKMPSVRELSENFKVNPNTVQRVFLELEREGITYSQRGIGTFVSEDLEIVEELKTTQAQKHTKRFLTEMKELGLTNKEISKCIDLLMEEHKNENT